ncbi:MAG TPA: PfkB family carbohydrate kinase [Blastocatellia bacterium]|nr:PfkB family carbohydrate kinase [Blastocatellia bacterium]
MEFDIEIPLGKPFDAVGFGLNAVDHLIQVPSYPKFNTKTQFTAHTLAAGGQSATAMVALRRLGLKTRYIGSVGSDPNGRFQLEALARDGVESSGVQVIEGAETQTAFIIVDEQSGERTILWRRDPLLTLDPELVDRASVTSGRLLHLDGHEVGASIRAAEYARDAGLPVSIDIDNIYPGAGRLLPLVDFLISSSSFPARMTGEPDLKAALKKLGAQTGSCFVAATLGAEGVLAYFKGEYIHSPAFPIRCRDTTGAGDAFHGGFIYGLLSGMTVEQTLRFANAVAGLKCRALGARTALPSLVEVNALIESGGSSPV